MTLMSNRGFYQIVSRVLLQPWCRWTRGMTLGVRAMVIDKGGSLLLVRHSYSPGWQFPGGGVERGETAITSLVRELQEEAAVRLTGEPQLFGFYSNEAHFRGDHVAFYIVREFAVRPFIPTREISDARFFSANSLPPDTTEATLRRIVEVQESTPRSPHW